MSEINLRPALQPWPHLSLTVLDIEIPVEPCDRVRKMNLEVKPLDEM